MRLLASITSLGLFLAPLAHAKMSCEDEVTLDDRYDSSQKTSVGNTDLLNRAFSPYLKSLHRSITQLSVEDIHEVARLFEVERARERVPRLSREDRAKGFTAAFKGNFYFYSYGLYDFDAPFTEFSKETMAKFDRALYVTEYLMRKKFHPRNDRTLRESEYLRYDRTFAADDLEKQFYYGFLSAAQSVGALIANPVGRFSAEELMRAVVTENSTQPSLVVIHSLMLPPRVLGPTGNQIYFKNAVELKEGKLTFSPEYRAFVKRMRDEFSAADNAEKCEHGHGCPIGHRLDGEKPSLQVFLNTVLYVYDRLPARE